jgi:hypothetical protein
MFVSDSTFGGLRLKTIFALAGLALLAVSRLCGAQPPAGITPEMIATALPEEGAPKAEPGRYQVTAELASGTPGLKTFRPSSLDRFPTRDTLPVIVWANGGCAIDNPRYAGFLTTIASHGFLVITTAGAYPEGAPRRQAVADDLKAAIDWVMWQLKGDRKASAMFVGAKCDLCTNPNWDVESKHLVK